jgi:bis(5'-nucleosyl)-tetraphosphatase (symmetrical)
MATYAIGDVHGCWRSLEALLARVGFERNRDRLWFTGDLVNRGPESLEVLRFVRGLGDAAVAVLGNHDLHLLSRAAGVRGAKRSDTLDDVLAAADREELLAWLRLRPLLHREGEWTMVHAGLLPQWSVAAAERAARLAETHLRAGIVPALFLPSRGPVPRWGEHLGEPLRARLALAALTRMRGCDPEGRPDLRLTGPPAELPRPLLPWFEMQSRGSRDTRVIFGHWAALGLHVAGGVFCLDTGCAWGGALTALRLDDQELFEVPAAESA